MIRKLEQLKKTLDKHTSWDMTVSKELYDLLLWELNSIQKLRKLVENKRNSPFLRLDLWDLVSEQIDEFSVPEIWLTKEEISSIRAWMSEEYCKSVDYDLRKDLTQEAKNYKNIKNILNKWSQIPKRLDAFERKSKWIIYTYNILQDCYLGELFSFMGYNWHEDAVKELKKMTLNLFQIKFLYKIWKLLPKEEYSIFVLIDNKLEYLYIHSRDWKVFSWWPWKPEKNNKLLFFSSTDIDT